MNRQTDGRTDGQTLLRDASRIKNRNITVAFKYGDFDD